MQIATAPAMVDAEGHSVETTPEPVRPLKAVAAWLKQHLLATFGVVGAAVTLLGSLEPFLELANLAQFIVDHWREWTRGLWQWLVSLVHLELPDYLVDALNFLAFALLAALKSTKIELPDFIKQLETKAFFRKRIAIALLTLFLMVSALIIFKSVVDVKLIATILLLAIIVVIGHISMQARISSKISPVPIVVIFVRIYIFLIFLIALNYIGIHSKGIIEWYAAAPWRD